MRKPETKDIGINPFSQAMVIEVHKVRSKTDFVMEEGGFINKELVIETIPYTKIYLYPNARKMVAGLTPTACKLLLWILYELEPEGDRVWINRRRCMKELGVSSTNTIKNAVLSLIKTGFVTLTVSKDVYWINPQAFFRGNRLKVFPERIDDGSEE